MVARSSFLRASQITYDSLGRKLSMDDPDMGPWTYAYDAVDNLITQTDARGVVTAFTYDALNRLKQKSYTIPFGSGIANPGTVTYTYDDAAQPFRKGKLTGITDGSGSSSFEYDNPKGNADTEQSIRTLKEECLWLREWPSPFAVGDALATWFESFNVSYLHSSLGYRTPEAFEQQWISSHQTLLAPA